MAATNGLFVDSGLDINILDAPGGSDSIVAVANGEIDFCLTSIVRHYFLARKRVTHLAARFVAIVTQENPLSVIVGADSPYWSLADLGGLRIGGDPENNPHVGELRAVLKRRGLMMPSFVPMEESVATAFSQGEIDGWVGFADGLPRARRRSGRSLRNIAIERGVYASGLIAADGVPQERVIRMSEALVEALRRQREDPTQGVATFCERYPETHPDDALESWRIVEPFIFTKAETGSMKRERWQRTLEYASEVHGVPVPDPASVYRPDCVSS